MDIINDIFHSVAVRRTTSLDSSKFDFSAVALPLP